MAGCPAKWMGEDDFDGLAVLFTTGVGVVGLGVISLRSNSTELDPGEAGREVVAGFHSSMVPVGMPVARSPSTGTGAVPAGTKAEFEGPAVRPEAFSISTV